MLSVTFDATQDRLLLEIKATDQSNYVWLSRRATILLGQIVEKLLIKMYAKSGITDVENTVAKFSQEALDAAHPPKRIKTASTPDGILAHTVSSNIIDPKSARLAIKDAKGTALSFVISRELLHLLLSLLKLQAAQAEWGLDIGFAPAEERADKKALRQ